MRACALFLLALSAIAQPLRFEVSTVRPSEPLVNSVSVGFQMDKQQLRITQLPLGYYIQIAYEVKGSQVVSSGSLQDRFDVTATLPAGANQDKLPEMMRGLLEERFQLKTHREQREMQVYAITLSKGPLKIVEVADSPVNPNEVVTAGGSGGAQGISLNLGNGTSLTFANNKFEGKKLAFSDVAGQMEQFVDRPVVDQTGLKGHYDFTLEFAQEDFQMMRARSAVNAGFPLAPQILQRMETAQLTTLFEAFEKLGLKLETKKVPVPVIVVDRVLKVPTEKLGLPASCQIAERSVYCGFMQVETRNPVRPPMQPRIDDSDPLAPQREAALFYGLFLRGHSANTLRRDIDVPKKLLEKLLKRHPHELRVRENLERSYHYRKQVLAIFDELVTRQGIHRVQ